MRLGEEKYIMNNKSTNTNNNNTSVKTSTYIYVQIINNNSTNYNPVSLNSVPGKVMELFILTALTRHVEDNQEIRPSQNGFMKGRSCFTNWSSMTR